MSNLFAEPSRIRFICLSCKHLFDRLFDPTGGALRMQNLGYAGVPEPSANAWLFEGDWQRDHGRPAA